MSKLSDFKAEVGGISLEGEPTVKEFISSGNFIAPSSGYISILATGGGSSSGSTKINGGDTIISLKGQWVKLGGGVKTTGGIPSFSENWEYGQGNCFTGQSPGKAKNHPLQVVGVTAFAKTRESEVALRKSNLHGIAGGGGGDAVESTNTNVYKAGGIYGGAISGGGAGAAIMVSQIIPVAEGDEILITIGAGGKTGASVVAGDGGNGICIISFYGA